MNVRELIEALEHWGRTYGDDRPVFVATAGHDFERPSELLGNAQRIVIYSEPDRT